MGPIVLFDKSFVEMLNVDEAALFDFLYLTNICPMFLTEVLADLEKETSGQRSREKIVADVARKTPSAHSYPNVLHSTICLTELHGRHFPMAGRPVVGGGRPVRLQGEVGVYYEESPEMKAYSRWQEGKFLEVERDFARHWRAQLATADLTQSAALAREALAIRSEPRNLAEAMEIARPAVLGDRNRYRTIKAAYALLGLPAERWPQVLSNWKAVGGPPLAVHAPYTAHCLLVDTFFHVAVAKKLISPDRLSNRVDIAYLYYLPFAMAFVSNDKLHKRVVPLLLRPDQTFIDGEELKVDLEALDVHYSGLPAEQLEQGLFRFAEPPDDDRFLTTRLYRQFGFRVGDGITLRPDQNEKIGADVLAKAEALAKSPASADVTWQEAEDADHLTIERKLTARRGKWRVMSPEAEASARTRRGE
jgi:hypothetical protein